MGLRGWVGLGVLLLGVTMLFFEQTKSMAWFIGGLGGGLMASGFS